MQHYFENEPEENEKCFSDIFVRAFADGRDINSFNNSIVILIASLQQLSQHWSRFFNFQNHSLEKIQSCRSRLTVLVQNKFCNLFNTLVID